MEENKVPFIIVGTGPQARLALDIAQQLDILVYGFIGTEAEEGPKELNDVLVLAQLGDRDSDTLLADQNIQVVLAESDHEQRKILADILKTQEVEPVNLVALHHDFSPYAQLGHGNIFSAGVHISANAGIGDFNLLGAYTIIGAEVQMGDYCTLQDRVSVGRGALIQDNVFIGLGAIIHAGVTLGEGAMIAAGAVVLQDVPAGASAFGNPAQIKA